MLKVSKPMWMIIAVAATAILYLTQSGGPTSSSTTKKKPVSSKTVKLPEGITEEDYTKRFEALNESAQNSFMPIIARMSVGGPNGALEPDAIPSDLAGGEPGWYFTGTASVDGVMEALVENRSTGEGDFLKLGEIWKRVKVTSIQDGEVTIIGPNGQPKTLTLSYGVSEDAMASSTVRPLDPTLRGTIGNGNGNATVELAPSNNNGSGGGRSRRGGGNAQPVTDAGAENESF